MREIILAILFIMCLCVVFFRMYTTIKDYKNENKHLIRQFEEGENENKKLKELNEELREFNRKLLSENEDLKQNQGFKQCKIELPPHYMSEIPFETYKSAIELPLYDFKKIFNSEIDTPTKEHLAGMLAENLVKDEKIRFTVEEDILYDSALLTATIRIVNY